MVRWFLLSMCFCTLPFTVGCGAEETGIVTEGRMSAEEYEALVARQQAGAEKEEGEAP